MRDTLASRGPDHAQSWVDERVGLALGHRRLSVLDVSADGNQPMQSAGGRYTVIYNGEIFNFLELRQQLAKKGHAFRTRCDTEVMLAAFCEWGVASAIERFNGEFAFAVWDSERLVLTLARDRLGVKPLYYAWTKRHFLFASQPKAIRAHPAFDGEIDRDAVAMMLRYNYVPAPHAIYAGMLKVPAGTLLTIPLDRSCRPQPTAYWSALKVARHGRDNPFKGSEDDARLELEAILSDAVRIRMLADVPIGAWLSGGIDSSTVVALMQKHSHVPVRTFSIGFHEKNFDETEYAAAVARHLGTAHVDWRITAADAIAAIPKLARLYDEPFSDHSQIPACLLAGLTRRHVTVTLSGDGGDELFAGYGHYFRAMRLARALSHVPAAVRRAGASVLDRVPFAMWRALAPMIPRAYQDTATGRRVYGLPDVMRQDSRTRIFDQMQSGWAASVVMGAREPEETAEECETWLRDDYLGWMQLADLVQFLPDDILVKLDRASMGVGLEARVPLLDHRLVEFAWSLPGTMKVRGQTTKWILRQVLYRHVPKPLVDRPKRGFGVPIGLWLRGDLRPWAEALLDGARLTREGFIDPRPVRKRWQQHLTGTIDWGHHLWRVLMFQAWLEAHHEVRAAA